MGEAIYSCGPSVPPEGIKETLGMISGKLGARKTRMLDLGDLKPAAVALPLLVCGGELSILFTVRTDKVEHHKSEISFPGGRVDSTDRDDVAAALRETFEEIGTPPAAVHVLGRLDDFHSISGYRVRPFAVFLSDERPAFAPHPGEVSEIITIPVSHLVDSSNHSLGEILDMHGNRLNYFKWENKVVWGLTGAILRHFLELTFDFRPGEDERRGE